MMLLCGWYALNALLGPDDAFTLEELRAVNRAIHRHERAICPDGCDTAPEASGNFPIDVLIAALELRGRRTEHVHPRRRLPAPLPREVIGYLVGTGVHYVAIVRDVRAAPSLSVWMLVDDGHVRLKAHSPAHLVSKMTTGAAPPPRAVLRVWSKKE